MISLPPYPKSPSDDNWKGYTLEEIQMRRALVQARMEIQKFRLGSTVEAMKERTPVFGGSGSLFSRLTGALSFAEYAFIGIRLFKMVAPIFRRRR